MLKSFKIFFIFFLALRPASAKHKSWCPSLALPRHGTISCFRENKTIGCELNAISGSIAEFRCDDFYKLEGEKFLTCQSNGSWSSLLPKCVPDCGRRNSAVTLIVNGELENPGAFPWHVAIYNFIEKKYEYWCGGNLISENAVLTAAHCTWKIAPKKLILCFGKFHREFDFKEDNVQKIKATRIEMLNSYQDISGNYNGDLSLIFLEKPVKFNWFVKPICLDWNQQFMETQLAEGSLGSVPGWGLTENDTFSDSLRFLKLPVISDQKCIAEQERDFRKFITYTSFCAGFKNGTGVCNGDSGGGLVFYSNKSNRWYLQGLVSVSPRKRGTFYCDPHFYTVFTKVGLFMNWLKKMKQIEEKIVNASKGKNENCSKEKFNIIEEVIKGKKKGNYKNIYGFIKNFFNKSELEIKGEKIFFPHSKKILESAGLINKTQHV